MIDDMDGATSDCASTRLDQYGAPNSYVAVVCVAIVPTPVPEKNIRSNIWWGLSPGIYGIHRLIKVDPS